MTAIPSCPAQSCGTPEQRAASLPWALAMVGAKFLWLILFLICLILGYFLPGQMLFRVMVALCAIAFISDELVLLVCVRKLGKIQDPQFKMSRPSLGRSVFSLIFRTTFAYMALRMWVFPTS